MSKLVDKLLHHGHKQESRTETQGNVPNTASPSSHADTTTPLNVSAIGNRYATLPTPQTFTTDLSQKWTITRLGTLHSTSMPSLGWDKGRTSIINDTPFWNFGDVLSTTGGVFKHGMSMGAAFYASRSDLLAVNTLNYQSVAECIFAKPHHSDEKPRDDTEHWGMDTSNVVEVSPGVGIGFVWEIWRDTGMKFVDRGLGIIKITLGKETPLAERFGPLSTGPEGLQVGLMTIMKADGYLYTYTNAGPTGIVVGRVKLEHAFDDKAYEFLRLDGTWVRGIPRHDDPNYGIQTVGQENGKIHSDNQGSIMWNEYLQRYMLFTCMFGASTNFYLSETPYGPWSQQYTLLEEHGYGINVHPWMDEGGDGRVMYVSSGSMGNVITMWKVELGY